MRECVRECMCVYVSVCHYMCMYITVCVHLLMCMLTFLRVCVRAGQYYDSYSLL